MKKTVALVLTFNRLPLLKVCIDCLRNQTAPVDQIIVVNNCSTDGTLEWLTAQTDLTVVTTASNLGGAAGFVRGITEAYEQKSQWIWIMDDDAFPEYDCLEKMYKVADEKGTEQLVLSPLVIEAGKVDHLHRGYVNFNKKINFPLQDLTTDKIFETEEPLINITFASYIGMFLGREIVTKVGLPFAKYYIFQDDLEYSIRISKAGFPLYLVKDAIIHHKIKKEVPENMLVSGKSYRKERRTLSQIYLDKRNKYTDASKINRLLFISKRNMIWTIIHHNGMNARLMQFLIKDIFRSFTYVVLSKENRAMLLRLFYHTYSQGLSGKFDNPSILASKSA
jgi:GT2 family glycosyltransferase